MDIILECGINFRNILNTTYRFVFTHQRKAKEIDVDFRESDFYHLAGFQYLDDIAIPRDKENTLKHIIDDETITDEYLQKSKKYSSKVTHYDVKSRIEELRFIEEYIDVDNLISIYDISEDPYLKSNIRADYMIESRRKYTTVYIFLAKRKEAENTYCVASFFVKRKVIYSGKKMYWMLKEKNKDGIKKVLYRHPNYK